MGFKVEGEKMEEKPKTFYEFIKSQDYIDCDLEIGNVDMPASFVWDNELYDFTELGKEYYKDILNANFEIAKITDNYYCIVIFCDDDELGEDFSLTCAGCTPSSRFDSLIKEIGNDKDKNMLDSIEYAKDIGYIQYLDRKEDN